MKFRFPKSKLGLVFVVIFILFSSYMIYDSFTSDEPYDRLNVLVPALPWFFWIFLFDDPAMAKYINNDIPFWVIILHIGLSYLINAIIFYWIGLGIQKLFTRHKKQESPQ